MDGKIDHKSIPEVLLPRLSECLTTKIGLHFSNRNRNELHQKITASAADFGFGNVIEYIEWLLSSSLTQKEIEILAGHLTIGETYFFREKNAFKILEHSILPGLVDTRRKTGKYLRFWSAGCSSGEEPYSIAILLNQLIHDLKDWDITILATDINNEALRKAEEGIYSDWSFRDTPPFFKDKNFERINDSHYRLLSDIRKMVTFSSLNLSQDVYPALQNNTNAMDVIFCRNVLMYFAPEYIKQAIERFCGSLIGGGYLIVSPVENSLVHHAQLAAVHIQDSTFFSKDTRKIEPAGLIAKCVEKVIVPCPITHKKSKRCESEKPSCTGKYGVSGKTKEAEPICLEEISILSKKGFYQEAEERLGILISNGCRSREIPVLFTKILANQGKLEAALHWCEKAIANDKLNPRLHYLLAIIFEEQKRSAEAKASLRKALYLDHNFVLAHFALANLSLRLGNIVEARKHFENTVEILMKYKPDEILPESEGITAERFSELIGAVRFKEI